MKELHGGDIYRNQVDLDVSVNVNPLGMPERVKDALFQAVEHSVQYPDLQAEELRKKVSAWLQISEEGLLFGNGASELFLAIVHAVTPRKILIPVPSFSGYEYAAKVEKTQVEVYETRKENGFTLQEDFLGQLTEDVGLVFLCNPNNPTGACLDETLLRPILVQCEKQQIVVVLDECFLEFVEGGHSMIYEMKICSNLIVVRAFTKICSIPGVRLGYAYCENALLREKIRKQLPEWNISTFAQAAGVACVEEQAFFEETKYVVKKEREFLERGLLEQGYQVFPGEANFLLLESEKPLYEMLLKKGILIRDCANFRGLKKGYYRIAVKTRKENERFLQTLKELQEEENHGN